LLAAIGAGTLLVSGAVLLQMRGHQRHAVVPMEPPAPVEESPRPPATLPPPSVAPAEDRPSPSPGIPPTPHPARAAKRPPKTESSAALERSAAATLAAERAMVERARDALAHGDGAAALRTTEDYKLAFPQGTLAEEAEFLRIAALAHLGRGDEAARATEAFRKRFPNSPLEPNLPGR
jgi:hypothetical protein